MTTIEDTAIIHNDGKTGNIDDFKGQLLLVVNTASECGFTPQYESLQKLQDTYADRGFSIVGVPSNQFGEQEPGTDDEIREFTSGNFGVKFPLLSKTKVKGEGAHPIFRNLEQVTDSDGEAGEIKWNFEKFLVSPEGEVLARFRSTVEPDSSEITEQIEAHLPK